MFINKIRKLTFLNPLNSFCIEKSHIFDFSENTLLFKFKYILIDIKKDNFWYPEWLLTRPTGHWEFLRIFKIMLRNKTFMIYSEKWWKKFWFLDRKVSVNFFLFEVSLTVKIYKLKIIKWPIPFFLIFQWFNKESCHFFSKL